jgi:hypothetical protein
MSLPDGKDFTLGYSLELRLRMKTFPIHLSLLPLQQPTPPTPNQPK